MYVACHGKTNIRYRLYSYFDNFDQICAKSAKAAQLRCIIIVHGRFIPWNTIVLKPAQLDTLRWPASTKRFWTTPPTGAKWRWSRNKSFNESNSPLSGYLIWMMDMMFNSYSLSRGIVCNIVVLGSMAPKSFMLCCGDHVIWIVLFHVFDRNVFNSNILLCK